MVLTPEISLRLVTAIETNSLVFLCGAGLSIPAPSGLPSAVSVAQTCYDKWLPVEVLPAALRADVDGLAGHFFTKGDFEKVFIRRLVPWGSLVGHPNNGHAAVADLLICRAAHGALSANFDPLIEQWAEGRKIAMRGALTGQEATDFSTDSNPLIKFHGCIHRDRERTLWTKHQLTDAEIQHRITTCSQWMTLNLPGKDLVVVGFWSDWGYLNDVIANAFAVGIAHSVTVIDPCSSAELIAKGPVLWAKLNALSNVFAHVRASGAETLDELRTAYSKVWVRKFYSLGQPLIQALGIGPPAAATPDMLTGEQLYDLRLDAEGIPYNRAAKLKAPSVDASQSAFIHLLLLNAGANQQGAWLRHGVRTVRIVNGAGQGLADVQSQYTEPTSAIHPDIVVCAGAVDFGVPPKIIPSGHGASIVRPAPGGGARWLTLDQARAELAI